jgi:CBS domain-containing protein
MTVQSIMTSKPASCRLQSNLAEVARIMWEDDCGVVPIVDDAGKVAGVVTDRDVCIAAATRNRTAAEIHVGELPRGDVVVCHPGDTVKGALALMRDRRLRRLPVTAPNGELVGILSLNDIVLAAGRSTGITAGEILEAMQGICSHPVQPVPAAKAATA